MRFKINFRTIISFVAGIGFYKGLTWLYTHTPGDGTLDWEMYFGITIVQIIVLFAMNLEDEKRSEEND